MVADQELKKQILLAQVVVETLQFMELLLLAAVAEAVVHLDIKLVKMVDQEEVEVQLLQAELEHLDKEIMEVILETVTEVEVAALEELDQIIQVVEMLLLQVELELTHNLHGQLQHLLEFLVIMQAAAVADAITHLLDHQLLED
jgi:hypothetical protein